jgi:hypothetical protein
MQQQNAILAERRIWTGLFDFSSKKPDPVPTFSKNGLSVKRTFRCKAMNSKNKERLRPTGMRQECLVSSQALFGFSCGVNH